jgi:6-pyruvoyltetrahydropterin/6-carboxytetrahydropterin synthase
MELYASRTARTFSMKLTQTFYFEAAHTLKGRYVNVCDRINSEVIHGHTYHASISVEGKPDESGIVKDFNAMGLMVDYIKSHLDHKFLDEVEGLGRPTMENLCLFIAEKAKKFKGVCEITVERKASGDKCTLEIKNLSIKEIK